MRQSETNLAPHLSHIKSAIELIPGLLQTSETKKEQLKAALEQLLELLIPYDEERVHSLAAKIHLMFTALKQEKRNSDVIQKTGKDMMVLTQDLASKIEALPEQIKNLLKTALVP